MSISTFVQNDGIESSRANPQSMAILPIGTSIDNSTMAAIEENKMHESVHGYEMKSVNQSVHTVRNIMPPHEKMLKTVQASISKTKEVLVKTAQLSSNASNTDIKVYNIDDSQTSNQFDIVISRDKVPREKSDVLIKISELEKEAEELDRIKHKFDETLRKSVKLAQYNYENDKAELGVLDSQFNSQLQSIAVSHAVSPTRY